MADGMGNIIGNHILIIVCLDRKRRINAGALLNGKNFRNCNWLGLWIIAFQPGIGERQHLHGLHALFRKPLPAVWIPFHFQFQSLPRKLYLLPQPFTKRQKIFPASRVRNPFQISRKGRPVIVDPAAGGVGKKESAQSRPKRGQDGKPGALL